ncbi:Serine--pyruvate aminotransferase / L-alanine:glyoxylate aminotransferase [hydrothermal vent metagenome]|uniref:Serine--pyruvate aminotransferase / L-alanine:glyoxylate aminotransferase n=1 Tax=hydrothermal vent metagenome TaxID=652676 RepID=A0A3B1A484_9ZZZZ
MITSFQPPIRTLMGPGPSDVSERVLAALARPTIGHLDPAFVAMMDELKELLKYAFQTKNELTFPVSAPGSAGMETCFVNLLEPGDQVVVCINGVFGNRMKENIERCGATAIVVEDAWGEVVDPQKLEDTLKANVEARFVCFVHAETSTGALSDAKTLVEIAHKHGCLTIVDAVTSLGGSELRVDGWKIDAIYSGTQKCLSAPPGLSPVSFSQRAADLIKNRKSKVQSWFLDMSLVMDYWGGDGKRTYHHTAPVNSLYALHESLLILKEEGLENSWKRHSHYHNMLRAGIEAMGLSFIVKQGDNLPQLNSVTIPGDVDDVEVRGQLLKKYNIEIGAGLGTLAGKVWRIGLMGHACNQANVEKCLSALNEILLDLGTPVKAGSALSAAQAYLAANKI